MDMWTSYTLTRGVTCSWHVGSLCLWLRREEAEWLYAVGHYAGAADAPCSPGFASDVTKPDELAWNRVFASGSPVTVELRPVLPDGPVVIKSEEAITFLPGTETELYARIPLWVSVHAVPGGQMLLEAPTEPLSRTWFGESMKGTLGYSAQLRLESRLDCLETDNRTVICPLRFKNLSGAPHTSRSFVLLCEQLTLYRKPGPVPFFITNAAMTTVASAGELNFTVLHERVKKDPSLQLEARPRKRVGDSWWKKGYMLFQRISNF